MTTDLDFTSDRVKRIRVALGITQAEFGKLLGVVENMVSRYERGETTPTQARVLKALLEVEAEVADAI